MNDEETSSTAAPEDPIVAIVLRLLIVEQLRRRDAQEIYRARKAALARLRRELRGPTIKQRLRELAKRLDMLDELPSLASRPTGRRRPTTRQRLRQLQIRQAESEDFPIESYLPMWDFSRLLDDVHRELEEEIERSC